MEFNGPAHYYFWMGIEKGRGSSIQGLPGWLDGMCPIDNKTSERCREAFSWGFCWGLVTEEADFIEPVVQKELVIEPIEEDNMQEVVDEPSDDLYDDLERDYPFSGEA